MADGARALETIIYERRGPVAVLTLNKPDRLNALGAAMRAEVEAVLEAALADDAVRALVLTGAGRGFCSGADLTGAAVMAERPPEPKDQAERLDEMGWVGRWATMWARFDKPVVGAINGVAAGAGASLAMACDLRIASEAASFALAFGRVGLVPDSGATWFLPRLVGEAKAAEIALLGDPVPAAEALGLGLVGSVVPAEGLATAARSVAARLAAGAPKAIALTKRALATSWDRDLESALAYEAHLQDMAGRTADHAEGMAAFLEKRPPRFSGS